MLKPKFVSETPEQSEYQTNILNEYLIDVLKTIHEKTSVFSEDLIMQQHNTPELINQLL